MRGTSPHTDKGILKVKDKARIHQGHGFEDRVWNEEAGAKCGNTSVLCRWKAECAQQWPVGAIQRPMVSLLFFSQVLVLRSPHPNHANCMQIVCNTQGGSCKRVWPVSLPWVRRTVTPEGIFRPIATALGKLPYLFDIDLEWFIHRQGWVGERRLQ